MKIASQTPEPEEISCPIDRASRVLGDRWTLLILRDIIFEDRRCFRDLRRGNPEGIASNMLAGRLRRMVAAGLLTQAPKADSDQRRPYALTEHAIALVPLLANLGICCLSARPSPADLRARLFYGGGPKLWAKLQEELRAEHLNGQPPANDGVRQRLRLAESRAAEGCGPLYMQAAPNADDTHTGKPEPGAKDRTAELLAFSQ